MSNEKVYEALKTIKELCKSYNECKDCPLSICSDGNCSVETNPYNWEPEIIDRKMRCKNEDDRQCK